MMHSFSLRHILVFLIFFHFCLEYFSTKIIRIKERISKQTKTKLLTESKTFWYNQGRYLHKSHDVDGEKMSESFPLSHMQTHFNTYAADILGKHCGKRRNCS